MSATPSFANNNNVASSPLSYPTSPADTILSTSSDTSGQTTSSSTPPVSTTVPLSLPMAPGGVINDDSVVRFHPYLRSYARKERKPRQNWNHCFEKLLFTPYELESMGAPHRRTTYLSSLEAHIDSLHAQFFSNGFWPVALEDLEPYKGMSNTMAKSIIAGRQYDSGLAKVKLRELQRTNEEYSKVLLGTMGCNAPRQPSFSFAP